MNDHEIRVSALTLAISAYPQLTKTAPAAALVEIAKTFEAYIAGDSKAKTVPQESKWTTEDTEQYLRARGSIVEFAKILKVLNIDRGYIPAELNPEQLRILEAYQNNSKVYVEMERQKGTTTILCIIALHQAIFFEHQVLVFMNTKMAISMENRKRVMELLESVPKKWVSGLVRNNKTFVEFENGSSIRFVGSTIDSLRGYNISQLFIDNAAFIPNATMIDIMNSIAPIMDSKHSKMLIATTTDASHRNSGAYAYEVIANNQSFAQVR